MSKRRRRLLLGLLIVLIAIPPAAWWAADSWLESSGGRKVLEQNLSERLGMDVRLAGEFDLMLFPDIGVAGTDLVIDAPAHAGVFASGAEYEMSLAIRPLFEGEVHIDWIRLTGGEIHPDRYQGAGSDDGEQVSDQVLVPEIDELAIRDFDLVMPGDEARIRISAFELTGFANQRETPFRLDLGDLASAAGWLRYDAHRSFLELGSLQLQRQGQAFTGRACVQLAEPVSLHLLLDAPVLDLDRLREGLPELEGGSGNTGEDAPLDIRIRANVGELTTGDAIARGVELSVGEEPVCGSD